MAGLPTFKMEEHNLTTHLKSIEELDIEWVQLIMEALDLGMDKEEIRSFLQGKQVV